MSVGGTSLADVSFKNLAISSNGYGINSQIPVATFYMDGITCTNAVSYCIYVAGNPSSDVTIKNSSNVAGVGGIFLRYVSGNMTLLNNNIYGIGIIAAINIQDSNSIITMDSVSIPSVGNTAHGLFIQNSTLSGTISNSTVSNVVTGNGIRVENSQGPLAFSNVVADGTTSFVFNNSSNMTLLDCISENGREDGFKTDLGSHDITFRRCISRNNGNKTTTSAGDGFTSHSTDYNIFIEDSLSYGNTVSGCAMVNTSSGHIYNSTFYGNGGNWSLEGGGKVDQDRGGLYFNLSGLNPTTGTGWDVRNNISERNYPVEVWLTNLSGYAVLNYNLYYPLDPAKMATINSLVNKITWDAYHTTNSQEANSISADPLFVSSSNFHLQNTSPAINAGTNSVWTGQNNITDYELNPITNGSGTVVASGGTVDIGAYEFQDSTAPTTTADIASGTYNTHQIVTLTCSDGAGVGCDKTYYSIDGTNPPTTEYSTAISIPDNAVTTLRFFSKDRSLNEEGLKTKTYTIDIVAPETTIDSNPNASINTNSATFTFSANETSTFQCKLDSGVYATCTTPKNYTSLSEGSHTFYVKATDTATSEDATPASYTFTVDTLVPTISDLSPNNTTLSATTTSTNLTLTTSETTTCKYSATSGTDYASMTAFNSTNNTTHSTAISSLNPGTTYDYYIICKDVINESAEEHLTFSIAPEENKTSLNSIKIKIERETNKFKDKIYSWKNKFKLKSQDDNLANGTVKIYKGNSLWKTVSIDTDGAWSKTLKLANDTTKTIKLKFYDALGTLLGTKKAKIKVDTEDPKFNEAIPEKMTIGKNQKIHFPATDDDSGIDFYKVKLSDIRDWRQQNENFYQIPQDVPNGTYDLLIRAYDKAGNYAEEKTTLNVSQYRNSVSLASASLNPYNTSERNTLNTENKIQNNTDKNTDTASNNSSSNNSPSPKPQSQPSPPAGGFKWYNPSTWF